MQRMKIYDKHQQTKTLKHDKKFVVAHEYL